MAKLLTTFICFFLLSAVSYARFSLENEDTVHEIEPLTYLNFDPTPVAKPDESTVPLTIFSFRHNLPLVRHRHNCRHGIKPLGGHDRYISYGKDMILSREKFLGVDPTVRGSPRPHIPAMWERFNQDPPRFDVNDHHHHHHHQDHDHHHRHHDHEMDGFMSKIRKFLGQF
jgi:hypothetical protein